MKKEKKFLPQLFKAVSIDRDLFQIRFVMSTPEIDRHGEIIDQAGWKLDKYLLNPVVLWGHDQSVPAVGKIVQLEFVNGNLEGTVQFAYKENPDAKILFDLYAEGYMSAVSVGFMNNKWMYDEEKDLLTLLENELFELSLVNVPANASALAKAKVKGIDTEVITRLNKGEHEGGDKFKNLGEEIKEEGEKEEVGADEVDEEKKPEEEVPVITATDEEVVADDAEPSEEDVKSALGVLFKSKRETIKASVKELSSRLNDAQVDTKESAVDASPATQGHKKGLSNRHINNLVRSLLTSKS